MTRIPELLAPAGGAAQLKAAVQSGADAVYMGGYAFNARRSARNFSQDEMREMIDYCRLYGVKTHIAVNTLIKERELEELLEYVRSLNDMGADALIVQDIGAAGMIRRACPDMELHASTQMTVTSLEGVRYLEEMGFDRVVLARELSRDEIAYICRNAKADIEVFVHGAICQCYSGQCLMSSILGGRSGNRGRCAQPCRLRYTLVGDGKPKSGFLLSPKDLSLINELSELKKIGVASLKIEGRLKRPEYVSAVTGLYRKYLDFPAAVTDEDMSELENAFSRSGFTDGYFKGRTGAAMMSSSDPSGIEKSFSPEAVARAAENADLRKIPVDIAAYISVGESVRVTISDSEGNVGCGEGSLLAETAKTRPLSEERAGEQLLKLGGTPFAAQSAEVFADGAATVPIKEINAARRAAAEELIRQRISFPKRRQCGFESKRTKRDKRMPELSASVRTAAQARAAAQAGIKTIYAPPGLAGELAAEGIDIIADTGAVFKPVDTECGSVLVSSNAAAYYYRKRGKRLYGDLRLNIYNSLSLEHYAYLEAVTLSPELNAAEAAELLRNSNVRAELIGYGRLPLMIMKNCPVKAAGHCRGRGAEHRLRDRKNEEFPLLCGRGCICELINSKPLFMADRPEGLLKPGADLIRLIFTIETPEECAVIIKEYKKALKGEKAANPFGENGFTRGHFFRGVE